MKIFKTSIAIPCFNEETNIPIIFKEIKKVLNKNNLNSYEIIFIDDGSTDNSLNILKDLKKIDNKIEYISFTRNFGHQNALKAGIDYATGDCLITIDADLQQPVETIKALIEKWLEGYQVVNTVRKYKSDVNFFKKITSKIFYKIINNISNIKMEESSGDFRLLDKEVVKVLKNIEDLSLFLRGVIPWFGFKEFKIEYELAERYSGKTKYSFWKMMSLALKGITSLSIKPLRITTILGFVFSFSSFIYGIYALIITLFTEKTIPGWSSTIISVLFIGGIQLLMLGIIGEYLGRLFVNLKRMPNYIIKEKSYSSS